MSARENEALIRRYMEAYNTGDLETVLACFTDDIVFHALHFQPISLPGSAQGKEGIRQNFERNRKISPDLHLTIEHLVAGDDTVAVIGKDTGTHEGSVFGEEPTHGILVVVEAVVCRIAGGKIAEVWQLDDRAGFWQQVGLLPPTREILPALRRQAGELDAANA